MEARRSFSVSEVLADYESVSIRAIGALKGLLGADLEVPLGDLGTYPSRILPCTFCFDHYIHIRVDLFAPAVLSTARHLPRTNWG